MYILGIESSCDETSLAIFESSINAGQRLERVSDNYKPQNFLSFLNSHQLLKDLVSSQVDIHALYGGVIPEIGAREHAEHIHRLFWEVLDWKQKSLPAFTPSKSEILKNLKYIMVTTNPGLKSGLRVGIEFAKSLQFYLQKIFHQKTEILEINHLHGHIMSCFWGQDKSLLDEQIFPHLHLLVSGGNTQIYLLKSPNSWEVIGQTLDDAAGETFDKVGRMLGLKYPAGVLVSRLAGLETGNVMRLPIGMVSKGGLNMSFAGLKTAARYKLQKDSVVEYEKPLSGLELDYLFPSQGKDQSREINSDSDLDLTKLEYIKNFSISLQTVIVKQIKNKFNQALDTYQPRSIGLSGGVSANPLLRSELERTAKDRGLFCFLSPRQLTGDNATMIGLSGISRFYK